MILKLGRQLCNIDTVLLPCPRVFMQALLSTHDAESALPCHTMKHSANKNYKFNYATTLSMAIV